MTHLNLSFDVKDLPHTVDVLKAFSERLRECANDMDAQIAAAEESMQDMEDIRHLCKKRRDVVLLQIAQLESAMAEGGEA